MRVPRSVALAITLIFIGGTEVAAQRSPEIALRAGLVITRSVRVRPGTYRLPALASLDSAVVTIRGDDVTVDFGGATLLGVGDGSAPDDAAGLAIRVDGGRNVTVRRARIHGYKVAILARGTRNLRLEDNDLSHNWKPRLYSLVEHESLVDWLSFHHNEKGEWLRFGAAAYLEDVRGGEVRGNVIEQGMNALLMTRTDSLLVWNNRFSFNSGLGIGLYRSSDNRILHNQVDYNVRGYSHGFYRRGQDSAGILIYEQSCRNVIAFNSVTHGGDGLFLWAGQSTMDTGTGGANDNVVYANDFSYAPTNGMEATFSRNAFVENRVSGSDYGLWGGYSYDSQVIGNKFEANRLGIAIEHGQGNRIEQNRFRGDSTAIRLWADSIEPSEWGYPKHRDTRSRNHVIAGNEFVRNRVALRVSRTSATTVEGNRFVSVDTDVVVADTPPFTSEITVVAGDSGALRVATSPELPADLRTRIPRPLRGGSRALDGPIALLPRSAIVVDEWGPYDWRTPKLWPADSVRAIPLRLQILGPPGEWRLVHARGVATLSKRAGRIRVLGVADTLSVTPYPDSSGNWEVTLEHRRAAGLPLRFSYARFEPRVEWTVRVFPWSDSTDPRTKPEAFAELLRGAAAFERHLPRLDLMWYRPMMAGFPPARWALEATGTVVLPPGTHTLRTISDDAVRVWVDGSRVIDDWTPHESAVDVAALNGGRHDIRVEYVQVDGWMELRLDIVHSGNARRTGTH